MEEEIGCRYAVKFRRSKSRLPIALSQTIHRPQKDIDINLQEIYEREKGQLAALVGSDPVSFLHRLTDSRDIEVAGFFASQFAYGRVGQVTEFLKKLFGRMEGGPFEFIASGDFSSLSDLYYRFQKGDDIIRICQVLRNIIDRYGSIGGILEHFYRGDLRQALWNVRTDLLGTTEDLTFFFPKPIAPSPLKRWNLYARWMVRRDFIDFGLWTFIDRSELVVPLDANIFKIGRCHGWTSQKAQTWKAASDITNVLKRFCPEDPLKYDFLLCHVVGIGGGCTGRRNQTCEKGCF
jgi:uncharacterized protein (TIGR02757 family)